MAKVDSELPPSARLSSLFHSVNQHLEPDALTTIARSAKISRSHGGIIVPQDIATILAAGPFKEAFGDRDTQRRTIDAFKDWSHYESAHHLDPKNWKPYPIQTTLPTDNLLARAHIRALQEGSFKANNLHILAAVLGFNGGEPTEPLSFITGDTSSALLYRELIWARAKGIAVAGYGNSPEYALAQETIARNLELRRVA